MIFKKLEAKRFLGFDNLEIDFSKGTRAIQGDNRDKPDQESNGSGKSGILYALEFALFGQSAKGGLESSHIQWGQKSSVIHLQLYCPVRKITLHIVRRIGKISDEEVKLELYEETSEGYDAEVQFSSINDGNKQIVDWIGISKEDLKNFFIISPDKFTSFMKSSNRQKLELIGRVVRLDYLDPTKDYFESKISELENSINSSVNERSRLEGMNEAVESMKEDILNVDHQEIYTAKKSELKRQMGLYEDEMSSVETSITETKNRLLDFDIEFEENDRQKSLAEADLVGITCIDLSTDIAETQAMIDEVLSQSKEYSKKYTSMVVSKRALMSREMDIKNILHGLIKCPNCGYKFSLDSTIDIDVVTKELEDITTELEAIKISIIDNVSDSLGLQDAEETFKEEKRVLIDKEDDSRKLKQDAEDKLNKIRSKRNNITERKNRVTSTLDRLKNNQISIQQKSEILEQQIKELKVSKTDEKSLKKLDLDIATNLDSIDIVKTSIDKMFSELDSQKEWQLHVLKFRSKLAKESLDIITIEQNKILDSMGSDLRIRWEGFKLNKDGSMSDKITPIVIRDGRELQFTDFSRGERMRMEYSSIITNQNLINQTNKYGGLDFLFTDEMTEGIDSLGLVNLVKSLSLLDKQILITTHVVNQQVSEDNIVVVRERGKSFIDGK